MDRLLNAADFKSYTHFYQLIWQPAAQMHQAWWRECSLEPWRFIYQACLPTRRWINRAIAVRRRFPVPGVAYALNPLERQLISLSERLPALLTALGLLRFRRSEYWMLKPYRRALEEHLDNVASTQLAVLAAAAAPAGFYVTAPFVEPACVVQAARLEGAAVLTALLPHSAAVRAVEILFEPQTFRSISALSSETASFGLSMLFRLARFL